MGRASSWAKFAATASLGAIHRGHCREAMNLLQPYLPQGGGATGAGYSEGGALYALGLIHANKNVGGRARGREGLRDALRNAGGAEAVLHGPAWAWAWPPWARATRGLRAAQGGALPGQLRGGRGGGAGPGAGAAGRRRRRGRPAYRAGGLRARHAAREDRARAGALPGAGVVRLRGGRRRRHRAAGARPGPAAAVRGHVRRGPGLLRHGGQRGRAPAAARGRLRRGGRRPSGGGGVPGVRALPHARAGAPAGGAAGRVLQPARALRGLPGHRHRLRGHGPGRGAGRGAAHAQGPAGLCAPGRAAGPGHGAHAGRGEPHARCPRAPGKAGVPGGRQTPEHPDQDGRGAGDGLAGRRRAQRDHRPAVAGGVPQALGGCGPGHLAAALVLVPAHALPAAGLHAHARHRAHQGLQDAPELPGEMCSKALSLCLPQENGGEKRGKERKDCNCPAVNHSQGQSP
ncbi:unnamed protein product [Heterosigma akashiwo]